MHTFVEMEIMMFETSELVLEYISPIVDYDIPVTHTFIASPHYMKLPRNTCVE